MVKSNAELDRLDQPFTVQQAIEYLTGRQRPPLIQIIGEYIRLDQTGKLDEAAVLKAAKKANSQADITKGLFYTLIEKNTGDERAQILDEYDNFPPGLKFFLNTYAHKLSKANTESTEKALLLPQTQTILGVLRSLVPRASQVERPLNDAERERLIHDTFRGKVGRPFSNKFQEKSPGFDGNYSAYVQATRRAEMSSSVKKVEHSTEPARYELEEKFLKFVKNVYDGIRAAYEPFYNPNNVSLTRAPDHGTGQFNLHFIPLEITQNGNKENTYLITFKQKLYSLLITNPRAYQDLYVQTQLLEELEKYLVARENKERGFHDSDLAAVNQDIERITNKPALALGSLTFKDEPDDFFIQLAHYTQLTQAYPWSRFKKMAGMFGQLGNQVEIMNTFFKKERKRQNAGNFWGIAETDKSLSAFLHVVKDAFTVNCIMSGPPQSVLRFPSQLSIYPNSLRLNATFGDYKTFAEELLLKTRVHVKNQELFFPDTQSPQFIYLALPQYAPVAELKITSSLHSEETQLEEGQDYIVQYESKTGHYRIELISQHAHTVASQGIKFDAGLDFIHKQKDVPQKIDVIKLSTEKIIATCHAIRQAGFARLANQLEKSLQPSKLRQLLLRATQQESKFTSKQVATAIRESIYYSFSFSDVSEELHIVNSLLQESDTDTLDFSYLPPIDSKNMDGRIQVQCRHVSLLYRDLLEHFMVSDDEAQLYDSSLVLDLSEGLTSFLGIKIFSALHSDTRGIVSQNRQDLRRFEHDLTPAPSLGTLRDMVKSTRHSLAEFTHRLHHLRSLMDIDLKTEDRVRIDALLNPEVFLRHILDLKREVLLSELPPSHRDREELEKAVQNDARLYFSPTELKQMAKTKPLAAVYQTLLFFQKLNVNFTKYDNLPEIIDVLNEVILLADKEGLKSEDSRVRKSQSVRQSFSHDIFSAAGIAKKLLQIIKPEQVK